MTDDSTIRAFPELKPPDLAACAAGLLGLTVFAAADASAERPEAVWLQEAARRIGNAGAARDAIAAALEAPERRDKLLARVARALDLSLAETAATAIALAVETETMPGRAVAWLQSPLGGARPALGLLSAALAPLDPKEGLSARLAAGRAVRSGLLTLTGSGPLPERGIALGDAMIAALTGNPIDRPGLSLAVADLSETWPASLECALTPLLDGLEGGEPVLLVVRAAAAHDRTEILQRIGARLGLTPALIDLETVDSQGLGPLLVAARLVPAFEADPPPGHYIDLPNLAGYGGPVVAFLGPDGHVGQDGVQTVEWTLPMPTAEERQSIWRGVFADDAVAERLGIEHLQSAGRIRELALAAGAAARLAGKPKPDADSLRSALWSTEGEGLGALAKAVKDRIPDEAMIAGAALKTELSLLLARCRNREHLTDGLGAASAARYKVGVRSLFTGPSGTGKTMAAAWLAGKLDLALYRVDLAAVSSKYIGETEKNLSRLLARAEEQEVILLFDEADSLFGKRTDISDANDRFANAQTNFLLQRIETYTGIVLLTSNSKSRF
ncbi:MAG: ATP-binding protein, partial [Alphaproteobacteria bacterium]|nr:ATP-binding protein [Alphaproteobacteria bacterium]